MLVCVDNAMSHANCVRCYDENEEKEKALTCFW